MWIIGIIIVVLLYFLFGGGGTSGGIGRSRRTQWTEEDDWAQLDEDLDDF